MSDLQKNRSYPIHTNRELDLMLSGRKPLAWFEVELTGDLGIRDLIGEQDFFAEVESGKLRYMSFEVSRDDLPCELERHFFFVPDEEWRAHALHALLKQGYRYGWCASMERLLGTLLGYTDEENDEHIAKEYSAPCA